MTRTINSKSLISMCGIFVFLWAVTASAFSWAPINPDELKMTSEPKAPGAAAIILEKQVDRDDSYFNETVYLRIKVLTDAGRSQGSIEIPYNDSARESIKDIEARVINTDGKVAQFKGKIFDKEIIKSRTIKYFVKAFTLPAVQVGSIIEYRYVHYLQHFVPDSQWVLTDTLFTRHAKYSLLPNPFYEVNWSWPRGLPQGTAPPIRLDGKIWLEAFNLSALVVEELMPPEQELKYRVDFIYLEHDIDAKDHVAFWHQYGTLFYRRFAEFINQPKPMTKAVASIVTRDDSNDAKLRKLYVHVNQFQNVDFAPDIGRQRIREAKSVADIEKWGYGTTNQLVCLFVALARAAGFEANMVAVSPRDRFFFKPENINPDELVSYVAVVELNGSDIYLQPGVPHTPFATLPWYESDVWGLRLKADSVTWIRTAQMRAEQATTYRVANYKVEGNELRGLVRVTYRGAAAASLRLKSYRGDGESRKQSLLQELKQSMRSVADIQLVKIPAWEDSEGDLDVEYSVTVHGVSAVGERRLIISDCAFGIMERNAFESTHRENPIYFNFPYVIQDEVSIEIPDGWQAVSVPEPVDEHLDAAEFTSNSRIKDGEVHMTKRLSVKQILVAKEQYLKLRDLFKKVGDIGGEKFILVH